MDVALFKANLAKAEGKSEYTKINGNSVRIRAVDCLWCGDQYAVDRYPTVREPTTAPRPVVPVFEYPWSYHKWVGPHTWVFPLCHACRLVSGYENLDMPETQARWVKIVSHLERVRLD